MRLLIISVLRNMRRHLLQTLLTFAAAVSAAAVLSFLFHTASGLGGVLRRASLEAGESWHFMYSAQWDTAFGGLLYWMADEVREDPWFSEGELTQADGQVELKLTVASPGPFTSRTMDRKLAAYLQEYRRFLGRDAALSGLARTCNYALLISYGDLNKDSGIYSFLAAFFLLLGAAVAAGAAVLGAALRISAVQREREFGLFMSIGAEVSQMRQMVLLESGFYALTALPSGYGLGIFFFVISRRRIDEVLTSMADSALPPVELTGSLAFSVLAAVAALGAVLFAAREPARLAASVRPMEAVRGTRSIYVPENRGRGRRARPGGRAGGGLPGSLAAWCTRRYSIAWRLAVESRAASRRRRRPAIVAQAVLCALCMAAAGYTEYTEDIAEMLYGDRSFNINVTLESGSRERLEACAGQMAEALGEGFFVVGEEGFVQGSAEVFSEEGRTSGLVSSELRFSPRLRLLGVEEDVWEALGWKCRADAGGERTEESAGTDAAVAEGIFIGAEQIWHRDGRLWRGHPYEIVPGEEMFFFDQSDSGRENKEELLITGILEEWPQWAEDTRRGEMTVLVPAEVFWQFEALPAFRRMQQGRRAYGLSVRGMAQDAGAAADTAWALLGEQEDVEGSVDNYEEALRRAQAGLKGVRYLLFLLAVLFFAACACGNFLTALAEEKDRQREAALLETVGMEPGEIRRMRRLEQLMDAAWGVGPGILAGVLCCLLLYKVYLREYALEWSFPWAGLLTGLAVLGGRMCLTEAARRAAAGKKTPAEILRQGD